MWFEDKPKMGEKNRPFRRWARKVPRQSKPADQRYESAYLFGAICPARGVGAGLALPFANPEAMQLHLEEISRHVAEGAHAALIPIAPGGTPPAISIRHATVGACRS